MKRRGKRAELGGAALEAAAAAAGLRVAPALLTATLPRARCTPAERARADELAAAAGVSLAEHIRRSST